MKPAANININIPNSQEVSTGHSASIKADVRHLNFFYGQIQALKDINLGFQENKITAIIGPSGCGKSTLLRCFNRIHDLYPGIRYEGEIILQPSGTNIVAPTTAALEMRMRVGMVFQKPTTFPKSIFENVAYGLRLHDHSEEHIEQEVERALRDAFIWDEVKDRLKKPAYDLSGGQQQRLCIARVLATTPEILLFDEPTSALDPKATSKIEDLIMTLKQHVTIIIVTHNMHQAARVSDKAAFMYLGELIEYDNTRSIFQNPKQKLTEDYITGHFG